MNEIRQKQNEILELISKIICEFYSNTQTKELNVEDVDVLMVKVGSYLDEYRQLGDKVQGVVIDNNLIMSKLRRIKKFVLNNITDAVYDSCESLLMIFETTKLSNTYLNMYQSSVKSSHDMYFKQILNKYKDDKSSDMVEVINNIKNANKIDIFNYDFPNKYKNMQINLGYDDTCDMYYTIYNDKRMYLKQKDQNEIINYIYFITMEQDAESPHRYFDETIKVKDGDIVIDAGVAEGNFALEVIDRVKKIYLIECDEEWVKALKMTFRDYQDKVVIVDKMLDKFDDDTHITIDNLCQDTPVNFIKMDIEGAEMDALKGAKNTISRNDDIRCAICSYHRSNAEMEIKEILGNSDFNTYTSKGYMWFPDDEFTLINSELRRGLVRAYKSKQAENNDTFSDNKTINDQILKKIENHDAQIQDMVNNQKEIVTVVQQFMERFNYINWDFLCKINNLKYELMDPRISSKSYFLPIIKDENETLDKIINQKCSFARFGDGEFSIMFNVVRQKFQRLDDKLSTRLKEVINFDDDKLLIGIADNYGNLDKYNDDSAQAIRMYMNEETRNLHKSMLKQDKVYYDAYTTRPYVIYRDNMTNAPAKRFNHLKQIWDKRNIIIIEGAQTRLGVANDLFDNAASISRIIAPATSSFDRYDELYKCALENAADDVLFVIAIGPSSGVLVYDLFSKGYQAVDVGHVDLEYEWFKAGKGVRVEIPTKYNNEIPGDEGAIQIDDPSYEQQIIAKYL